MPSDPPTREKKSSLRVVEAFRDLGEAEIAELEQRLKPVAIPRGGVVVRQGDAADALYIVISGRFRVMVEGRAEPIAEIGIGSPIGEIAFFAGTRRTATVTAARDGLLLKLDRQEFDRLSTEMPAIWRTITATLARRLAKAVPSAPGRRLTRPRTIAIVRAGSDPLPPAFISDLTNAFATGGRPLVVDRTTFANESDGPALIAKLNALEVRYHAVLYVTDDTPTDWTEKALRQADLVLLVAHDKATNRALNPVEKMARSIHDQASHRLVIVHDAAPPFSGSAAWLRERPVQMHHHVIAGDKPTTERLVRFLTNQALGLVCSGGGAFSAAHVGLYKAMLEAGLTFDMLGGASGGGAMTAAFALQRPIPVIDQAIDRIFVQSRAFRRLTWPRYSVLDHTVFDRELKAAYGDTLIEDLPVPYFAVSTDLSRNEAYVHRTGSLWQTVRATGSIPGLLPPVFTDDGIMLVDGSLVDNVPVKTMRNLKAGPNVVFSFVTTGDQRYFVDYAALPSRRRMLRHMLVPFGRKTMPDAPGPGSVLIASLLARGRAFEMSLTDEDLSITMPYPEDMSLMDWSRHSELLERSYQFGKEELVRLKADGHPVLKG